MTNEPKAPRMSRNEKRICKDMGDMAYSVLNEECKALMAENEQLKSGWLDEHSLIVAENAQLREALKFYADKKNWEYIFVSGVGDDDGEIAARIDFSDTEFFNGDIVQEDLDENTNSAICGKRARAALNKAGGGE